MEQGNRYKISFGGPLTPAVKILIIVNSAAFLLALAAKENLLASILGLVPSAVIKERFFWQPVTYMFLHAGFVHIIFNMLGLWWFGCDVERGFGTRHFIRYYFFTGIGAGIIAALASWGSDTPIIGASGALFGLLLAYAVLYPNRIIYLYFIIPIKAKWVVLIFAVVQLIATLEGKVSRISHEAHLGGLLFGLLWFGWYLKAYRGDFWRSLFRMGAGRRKLELIEKETEDDSHGDDPGKTVH